ncbi:LON peptidase N-terminal domain and RING finger protein 1 [Portunus trituberculatus]|uniref:LON peptidase N-terminal domain and RING finger protein 1 n=1 Tax=Portunus trituberculatus TaxID=210409 RepID=A0A5B7FPW0_PORTR|nr:LON peptidase N-terminal domain and RING finger protein 1 [Portunus trituberculatus]
MEGRNNCHHHSYSCLSPAHSDPSIIPESDSGEDSEDSEDGHQQSHCGPSAPPVEEVSHLRKIMDKFNLEMERNKKSSCGYVRMVEVQNYDKNDFECTLCYRYLYQPVTTPCGHSFCRTCLDRCLDHSTSCPLCKTSIKMFLAERRTAVTEFVEVAMQTVMASECRERKQQHDEEMDELAAAGKDSQHGIPIFIATLAIPTISCPLHVFEPRYRLMIRRCMESGTREFGMCMPMENAENGYADSGTMLEIRDIEYTPDGRSIVNTVGSRRFRIVSKSVKDGYNTAAVEFLQLSILNETSLKRRLEILHKIVRCVLVQQHPQQTPAEGSHSVISFINFTLNNFGTVIMYKSTLKFIHSIVKEWQGTYYATNCTSGTQKQCHDADTNRKAFTNNLHPGPLL